MRLLKLMLLLLLMGCCKTEILNAPIPMVEQTDTTKKVKTEVDTIQVDTTRVPITFNPSVEDWEENEIEFN